MSDMSQTPTLEEVILRAMDVRLERVDVMIPARIESYDPVTKKAEVQPLIMTPYFDEDEERQHERKAMCVEVPVILPGSGGTRIKYPVKVGDTVMLVVCSEELDNWLISGKEVIPRSAHRHNMRDVIAVTGLQAFPDACDAETLIEFTEDNKVLIGSKGGAKKSMLYQEAGQALKAAIAQLALPPGDPGLELLAAIKAAFAAWSPTGTTTTKAD